MALATDTVLLFLVITADTRLKQRSPPADVGQTVCRRTAITYKHGYRLPCRCQYPTGCRHSSTLGSVVSRCARKKLCISLDSSVRRALSVPAICFSYWYRHCITVLPPSATESARAHIGDQKGSK